MHSSTLTYKKEGVNILVAKNISNDMQNMGHSTLNNLQSSPPQYRSCGKVMSENTPNKRLHNPSNQFTPIQQRITELAIKIAQISNTELLNPDDNPQKPQLRSKRRSTYPETTGLDFKKVNRYKLFFLYPFVLLRIC